MNTVTRFANGKVTTHKNMGAVLKWGYQFGAPLAVYADVNEDGSCEVEFVFSGCRFFVHYNSFTVLQWFLSNRRSWKPVKLHYRMVDERTVTNYAHMTLA